MNLKLFLTECGTHISHVQNILFISSECPFHTLGVDAPTFQVYIIINYFFYRTTKVIGQQKPGFCKFKKVISKTDHKKKDFEHICTSQLFSSISLFCLEGVWSYLSSLMLVIVTFWDIHLHNM